MQEILEEMNSAGDLLKNVLYKGIWKKMDDNRNLFENWLYRELVWKSTMQGIGL